MNALETRKMFSIWIFWTQCLVAILAIFLVSSGVAKADDKKPQPPVKPATAAKPAATKSAPSTSTSHGATTTSHGPTTTSHGATTTTSHGATTANHGATTTSSPHGATTTGHSPNTGGHEATKGTSGPNKGPESTRAPRPLPKGQQEFHSKGGSSFTKRPDGRVATLHDTRRGMDIHHGLGGGRHVEVRARDGHRIVAERGGRGFVERPYSFHGRAYDHRTYYYNGRAYDHFYHGYYYRGAYVQMYTPAYYYAPAFYGWAYNPWVAPIPYAWGWAGNPWYGYYGVYFAPYPVYPSASYWLTDYLISTTLAVAYQARVDAAQAQANAQAADAVALTPEVKNLISAEVQRQIAVENAESSAGAQNIDPNPAMSGIQAMLNDNVRHIFVAGHSIDVVDASGAECAISEGDALQLTGPPPSGATAATLDVLSSKGGQDCRAGKNVNVEFADLQDMQNHMRETIDQGMSDLQSKQGKGGLPTIPTSASAAPAKAAFAVDAPGPDATAATEIAEQSKQADQAENEVVSQATEGGPGPSAPTDAQNTAPPIPFQAMGKNIPEVTAHYGQPKNIVDLGAKKIYVYQDLKITFKDDKVVDVQ